MSKHIAIVGAGLVGSGWAIVFARAGAEVRIYDSNADIRDRFIALVRGQLEDLKAHDLIDEVETVLGRMQVCDRLDLAVRGARYVQESVFERQDVKTEINAAISPLLDDDAVVGSSTSGIPASAFTEDLPNRERFVVAHPVNPPYLAQVVEVVPAPWTSEATVTATIALMNEVKQSPVLVRREVEGFVLNRLQGVLLREAWALYEEGYASLEDIDKTISQGLGLRWSFMGPFETIDMNAPGGIADYAQRLGPLYHSIQASRPQPAPWSADLIAKVEQERRQTLAADDLQTRTKWRDRRLMALVAHQRGQPR
mgnify:CR=1 FL=1